MNFVVIVTLQLLFVSGFATADDEPERPSNEDLKQMMCDEDKSDQAEFIVKCLDTMNFKEYKALVKECYQNMDEDITGENIRAWFCATPLEEIEEADTCTAKKLEEDGKGEEVYIQMLLKLIVNMSCFFHLYCFVKNN
ncbi:hypothetical protein TNCV_2262641 [Trichonephila clavipes]|nr:hypothetical protein TNCV_2262641 [Trichonephila clavipes]